MRHEAIARCLTAVTCISFLCLLSACGTSEPPPPAAAAAPQESPAVADLQAKIRRFAPVDIQADVASLPPSERQALDHIVEAARVMDGLFLQQVWAGNTSLLLQLAGDPTPIGEAERHYFLINKGPWSRLDEDAVFVRPALQVPPKPPQANYYPADATRDEVDAWFNSMSGPMRALATGFFSVIRRDAAGRLMAVPYSVEYRNALTLAADHLRRAAAATADPSLKRYLELRAAAFLSNDYYDSDIAWMELDAAVEPTIGPYETYEDAWFGYKAAFEAFVTLRDDAETKKLGVFGGELQGLEDNLPIDARYRNPKIGALAPIRVVNVVFTAGDANRGVQTAAFNLPNDDRVISEKGSKRVMLKNVQEAKFQRVLTPISTVAIAAGDRSRVSFDAFFTHILMHELMHGLGPQQLRGSKTSVREALKETYAPLEEAKADISGLWALQQLADKGVIPADVARSMYVTFLASSFRSIRFGLRSAHARGQTLQLNYLLDKGAVVVNADGTFGVVDDKIEQAVADLTRDLMTLQAVGDYAAATEMLKTMVVIRPEVQRVLDQLKDVPVDIEPNFGSVHQ
jgi:hypothetical protein